MQKKKLILYSLLLTAILAGFVFRAEIFNFVRPAIESKLQEFEKVATDALIHGIKEQLNAASEVVTPPPLRSPTLEIPKASTELTVAGTFNWTNAQRIENGLPVLKEDTTLDAIAELRIKDMFEKQYFAHVSPTGGDVQDVAADVGYEYITLGENLALGGFDDDQDLVQAWMDSPGHRANILNDRYTEIGIAVERGFFEGRVTWLAVQVFGKTLSLCPQPNPSIKSQIELLQNMVQETKTELEARYAELENMNRRSPEYRQKADEYNALVAQYNSMIEELKALIADYNAQITKFNACIQE
ncbi:MAG: CAP domain-containing protein [Patescibacteria group bacterium]